MGKRGPVSGRMFRPDMAGGPVRHLTTDRIRMTEWGIDVVEVHLTRFGPDAANQAMVQRLREIAGGRLQPTQADVNFYAHELREFVRYRRLGWRTGQPPEAHGAYALWNHAHTATLEDYRVREGPGILYHPSVEPFARSLETSMQALQHEILALIHAHDGKWSWYQIDRALSSWSPHREEHRHVLGTLMEALRELEGGGLVTTKAGHHPSQPVYAMTPKGQHALETHHKQRSLAT